MKCPCCKQEIPVIDRYEAGGEKQQNFKEPCIDCKHNLEDEDQMPCRFCTHS